MYVDNYRTGYNIIEEILAVRRELYQLLLADGF
jgi:hypothetical protein